MAPYPSQEAAQSILDRDERHPYGLGRVVEASAGQKITWESEPGTIEFRALAIRNPNHTLPYSGIMTISETGYSNGYYGFLDLSAIPPQTQLGVHNDREIYQDLLGVAIQYGAKVATIQSLKDKTDIHIRISGADEPTSDQLEAVAVATLMPEEAAQKVWKGGFVILEDPLYPSPPQVVSVCVPSEECLWVLNYKNKVEYMNRELWEKYGTPVVVHLKRHSRSK